MKLVAIICIMLLAILLTSPALAQSQYNLYCATQFSLQLISGPYPTQAQCTAAGNQYAQTQPPPCNHWATGGFNGLLCYPSLLGPHK